jgi:alpha-beta hydrolase superfamily lysophospholipase
MAPVEKIYPATPSIPVPDRPRWMDWLARVIAWGTITMPRIAPSRWRQDANRRRGDDLVSEWFEVTADDGVRLDAVRFPSKVDHARDEAAARAARPTLFFSHGWTETKEYHIRLVRVLTSAGFPVVLYDQRGHGRSGGSCTLGVLEPGDLRAVIDEAQRRGWTAGGDGRVFTMGVSLGGATVLRHAAGDARVAGVVAFTPYSRFVDAIRSYGRRYAPWFNRDWLVRGFVQSCAGRGFDIAEASPIRGMAQVAAPVLLVVGEADRNLPGWEHTRVLLDAARPGRCRMITVREATHFNICMRRWPGLDEQLLAFLTAGDVAVSVPSPAATTT